jgi:hypothetical protein
MTKIFPRSHANCMETPEQITDRKLRKEIALLKQAVAERALELDFLKVRCAESRKIGHTRNR